MSNYSLRNGADSPLPIGDIPVTPEGDYKTPHETPRAFFANGGVAEFRRAPRLRLQGRSLSARDPSYDFDSSPPPLRQHSPFRSKGRLLPNTPPEEAAMYEKNGRQQQTHGFWQLSPSEERIRRTRRQLSVNEDYEYGSHSLSPSPRLSPRHSPRASSNCSPSSPTPPTSTHASAQYLSVNPEDHLPRPPQEFRPSRDAATYRRMNFSRSAQHSMGQRDSRLQADHPQFSSSFDSGCSIQAGISKSPNGNIRRSGPFRTDSTTSEDTCLETNDNQLSHAGSSGSLHIFNRTKKNDRIKPCQRGYRSASANTKVAQKGTVSPPKLSTKKTPNISQSAQSIILYCMENARADTAGRIIMRMAHKRDDFAQFIANLSQQQWQEMVSNLREYLNDVVKHIHSADKIREVSYQFGINQVPKRSWGFKADFFAVMANALTTECVFLDGAAHQPTEAIEAWAELVELMFSNVRDGYYQQIRYLRKNSHCFSSANFSQSSDQSVDSSEPTNGSTASLSLPTSTARQNSDSSYSFSYSPNTTAPHASTIQPVSSPGVVIRF